MGLLEARRAAARAALAELPPAGVIGLGSGATARLFIEELAALVRAGRDYRGVATSEASRALAAGLGIPLLPDEGPWEVDVTVDGADEVDPRLDLIKGGGGAQAREKVVNQAARRNVIVVDEAKLSARLGERWPVPLEVARFGHRATARALERLGRPEQRLRDGAPVVADSGGLLYDLHTGPIADPAALDRALRQVPGLVETGLFVGRADVVLVGGDQGARRLTAPPRPAP